ncbi:unnamed protein product [Heligmosomoides polygyrus]|uniref:BAR domain-containing protein n=1 Tax=Heligmosomoides polygyrus TaxID=6339 RepID=A0A183G391_HELPZ|nr:unnamed protein product [Heligmosomoides polygyrus]
MTMEADKKCDATKKTTEKSSTEKSGTEKSGTEKSSTEKSPEKSLVVHNYHILKKFERPLHDTYDGQSEILQFQKFPFYNGESKRRKNLKRLFFRIKESIGLVEKTEVSKEFTQSLVHLDKYKICLDSLAEAICGAIQENPKYRKEDFKMDLTPPPGSEEHELVAAWLLNGGGFEDYKNQKKLLDLYEKQGSEHREYIKKARASIGNIRTFIQNDYWVIGTQRTDIHLKLDTLEELDTLRREMDFAKAELKAAKDEQLVAVKNQLYNMAVAAFEEKLKKVTALVDDLPKNKATHVADLEEWVTCTLKFHQMMAQLNETEKEKQK